MIILGNWCLQSLLCLQVLVQVWEEQCWVSAASSVQLMHVSSECETGWDSQWLILQLFYQPLSPSQQQSHQWRTCQGEETYLCRQRRALAFKQVGLMDTDGCNVSQTSKEHNLSIFMSHLCCKNDKYPLDAAALKPGTALGYWVIFSSIQGQKNMIYTNGGIIQQLWL